MNDVSPAAVATAADRTESGGVPSHGIAFREAVRVWARVAALSFGGPAGQIAVMHRILVEEKRWIGENRFLHALNYCMLLPGPEAQQLAVYVGWLLHKTKGGLVAGTLFVLPGLVAIMALSLIYAAWGKVGIVAALFFGLKAAVLAVVLEAVVRVGKRSLKNRVMIGLAAAAFVAIFFLKVPFPLIILGAGLIGYLCGRGGRPPFLVCGGHGPSRGQGPGAAAAGAPGIPPSWSAAATVRAAARLWPTPSRRSARRSRRMRARAPPGRCASRRCSSGFGSRRSQPSS